MHNASVTFEQEVEIDSVLIKGLSEVASRMGASYGVTGLGNMFLETPSLWALLSNSRTLRITSDDCVTPALAQLSNFLMAHVESIDEMVVFNSCDCNRTSSVWTQLTGELAQRGKLQQEAFLS